MTSTLKRTSLAGMFIILRLVLGVVFVYASWGKLMHPADFAVMVADYKILPPVMINPVALTLPWLEMVCGICLIIGWISRGSALILACLLLVFIGALAYSIFRGLDIQCGCFSLTTKTSVPLYLDILRDSLLLIMAMN